MRQELNVPTRHRTNCNGDDERENIRDPRSMGRRHTTNGAKSTEHEWRRVVAARVKEIVTEDMQESLEWLAQNLASRLPAKKDSIKSYFKSGRGLTAFAIFQAGDFLGVRADYFMSEDVDIESSIIEGGPYHRRMLELDNERLTSELEHARRQIERRSSG